MFSYKTKTRNGPHITLVNRTLQVLFTIWYSLGTLF